jgi:polysaccharide biosynthesis/export protein
MTQALMRILALFFTLFATSAYAAQSNHDYPLGPGDVLRIQVFQNPDLTTETRVSETGVITFPLIGNVEVGGLGVAQAEKKVAGALKGGGFVRQPQVNIIVLQMRGNQVSVLGQVNRPGRFPLETVSRVSDMLAMAGGATPTGDDSAIVIGMREGKPFRKVIDIPALYLGEQSDDDIILAGGDVIYVHRAPVFYIYGEAQRPGAYRIERGMTIMQALAQGGGHTVRGSEWRLRLHRKNGDGVVEKLSPEMSDAVQANDIIYVRESIF